MPADPALCIYCGLAEADTLDHIPPKCLFARPRPSNLLTVPSCLACNSRFARDDEYFRTAMALRWDVSGQTVAADVLSAALRSVSRKEAPGFQQSIVRTLEDAPIVTHSGLYVEEGARFEVDGRRINDVLERIVRGLYYKKVGTPLPPSHTIAVLWDEMLEQADPLQRGEILRAWAPITRGEPEVFGAETFLFFWCRDDNALETAWLLVFFSRVIFFAYTTGRRTEDGDRPSP
jgi:hypothetical protein